MSARSTISVFACGMSIPDSMIVVETSTSASPRRNECIRSSSSFSRIWPCATRKRSPGQSCCSCAARSSIVSTRLWRKNAWPSRLRLALERELHELLVVLAHRRPDRPAPLRRRLDDRDVAHAREREVQGARDRRRAQREHVDLEPQRLEQLLLRDAEPLLLVEDHEPELLRDHVAAEDAVRADEDVDLAGGEVGEDPLRLLRRHEPRDHLDAHREVAEPLAERVEVLLGEDRRRREEQHLAAVDGDGERGAHRDLGLAEADVAADEPVHRPRRLEVLLHRLDRAPPGPASRDTGSSPRAAAATRSRGRTRRPRASGAARRAGSGRRRARGRTRARAT